MNASNNIKILLGLSIEELYNGVSKTINYPRRTPCPPTCQKNKKNCDTCNGNGFFEENYAAELKIPAGVDASMDLNFKNKGHWIPPKKSLFGFLNAQPASATQYGNLNIHIKEKPHDYFKRKGNDLVIDLQLSSGAVLTEVNKTIHLPDQSEIKIKIPAHSENGRILRIKGKGFPILGANESGNLMIVLNITS